MIYNIAFYSINREEVIDLEIGLDNRPLRFTEKSIAEREVSYKNSQLSDWSRQHGIMWKVVEEIND